MALTTTAQIPPATRVFYDRLLIRRTLPLLPYATFAQKRNISKKSGDTIKYRKYGGLAINTAPLTEGITPPGQRMNVTELTARVKQYGDYLHITDVVDMTVEDPVLTEATALLSENMAQVLDRLCRDIMSQTASVTTSGANPAQPGVINAATLDRVAQTLMSNGAKPIREISEASDGVGTRPVRASFYAIAHTDCWSHLQTLDGWQDVSEYPNPSIALEGEYGTYKNIAFILTPTAYKEQAQYNGQDVYRTLVMGRDAYATTELTGAAHTYTQGYGSGGTSDPLHQRMTHGWKTFFTCRILQDAFIHSIRHRVA